MKPFLRSVVSGALALTMALLAAPASAKLTWVPLAAPGAVTSVGVASNDVPFVSTTDGKVWYLGRGKGACTGKPKICADKWIEIPGINTTLITVTTEGQPLAIDADSGRVIDGRSAKKAKATDTWVPARWEQAMAWQPGCVTSVVETGAISGGPLAFETPPYPSYVWDKDLYAVGCSSDNDTSIWIMRRWNEPFNGGVKSLPWRQLAAKQGAASQKVALFTTFQPAGPNEEVWFLDSYESGGRLWMYDKAKDVLVEQRRPPTPSTKPNPPPVRGTAITDHHARFTFGNSPTGKIYRWNDDTTKWVYLVDDPADAQIQNLAYAPSYEASGGTFGPSQLWANDTAGTLYVMRDLTKPK
jgi:hypothetical protein